MSANLSGTTKTNTITPVDDNTVGVIPLSARKALRVMTDDMEPDSIVFDALDTIRIGIQALRAGADIVGTAVSSYVNSLGFAIYHSTPTTRTTGQAGPLEADASGNLRTAEQYVTGWSFVNMTTATTATAKSGAGVFHGVAINTIVGAATITIYDNTAGSGTKIGIITLPAAGAGDMPNFIPFDVAFATGLTFVTSGATDITIVYL